ncbi:MAG: ABC transporter permease, partial [Candidatus Aminicenantes bacterium]|nr:ABC transporter permease [Candidatus Aminicenantes bacterium]
MLKNYLKVVFRNIRRHAGYSVINIVGLALGMACCLMIAMWVADELSFDRFHEKAADLYRVEEDQSYSGRIYHVTVTPYPLAPALKAEIPEIAEATRVVRYNGQLFRFGEKSFFEDNVRAVDPAFLGMFSFPLIKGDPATALIDPYSVLLTEQTAKKYFGSEDPVGKTLNVNNDFDLRVTGVLKNFPTNSSLRFDLLVPYELLKAKGQTDEEFGSNSILTFVELRPGTLPAAVDAKIKDFIKKRRPTSVTDLMLFPYTRLHLHQYFGYERETAVKYVYIFSVIAAFVLLIACINFMNLATARSAGRAKEVGLRKVVGALRNHLVARFYSESMIYAFLSLVIALALVRLFLPWFNTLSGKTLSLNLWANKGILLGVVGITALTGILAGSYPAIFLSSFHPVRVLKGNLKAGAGGALFRRALVVVQFALSVFLIIGTAVVYKQMVYMKSKALGYDKEQVLYIPLRGTTPQTYGSLREELRKDPRVLAVASSSHLPCAIGSNSGGVNWEGQDPQQVVLVSMCGVDFDFLDVMKIELVEGRNFSRDIKTDAQEAFLVNEEVRKLMNQQAAAGESFSFVGRDGRVVGVMKNFHFEEMQSKIEPLAIFLDVTDGRPQRANFALLRVAPGGVPGTIESVQRAWNAVNPGFPFDVRFLNDRINEMYRTEERAGGLLRTFAVLAILIACLGLFGLASFTAEQRTREIGIRKILGASVPQITVMLCREFFSLVFLANILAWPAAYWAMANWLKGYAYRTTLEPTVFVLALGL